MKRTEFLFHEYKIIVDTFYESRRISRFSRRDSRWISWKDHQQTNEMIVAYKLISCFLALISSIDDLVDSKPSSFYRARLTDKWLKVIENNGDRFTDREACSFYR